MKNQLFFILFFLMFSSFGFGQTQRIDSLKTELNNTKIHDTTKITLYLNLGGAFHPINLDSLRYYSELSIKFSKTSNDYILEKGYNNLSVYYLDVGKKDSARQYIKKVIELGKIKKDTSILIYGYMNYALTLSDNSDFEESVQLYLKALELSKNDKEKRPLIQYNLGLEYQAGGYDSLAIKYLNLAAKNAEKINNQFVLGNALSELAYHALKNNQVDLAKIYLDKSNLVCEKLNEFRTWSTYYLILGLYNDRIKMFDKAETAYNNGLSKAKKLANIHNIMLAYLYLGEHFVLVKNPRKAIDNFQKFERMNKTSPIPILAIRVYQFRAKAENMIGNFENSNEYLEKYIKINDSINSEKNKTSIANAETKYQSEKKDKELAEQKLALADQELAIQESNSKTRTMTILIVSLLLGSILLWFSFRQRQKRMQQQLVAIEREQEVRTLESLMEGEEKERLRIAKELHDGVNGDLAAIKFKLASLLETNNQVINEAVAMIDTSSEHVRAISHNLVPPSLRDFNLLEAVATYCENMNSIHDPEISFQHLGDDIVLEKKQEANLFRIVQELVTNSIKHAGAKEIHIQLSNVEDNLQLTVEDDGKGFDTENIANDGIGMQNVKSRVDYLGGLMDIKSDEKGTSFTITITDKPKKA